MFLRAECGPVATGSHGKVARYRYWRITIPHLLADALREGRVTDELLQSVQRRREFPTRMTQAAQANAHKVFAQLFRNTGPVKAPWQLKVAVRIPGITHVIGRAVGIGVRPEHIKDGRICNRVSQLVQAKN